MRKRRTMKFLLTERQNENTSFGSLETFKTSFRPRGTSGSVWGTDNTARREKASSETTNAERLSRPLTQDYLAAGARTSGWMICDRRSGFVESRSRSG